jgi:putative ABC transport system permease protein
MWKATWKGLLAHKFRLALTAVAIVIGVAFVSGTFVLSDTLHQTFTTLFNGVYQHIDFQVRGKAAFAGANGGSGRSPIPAAVAQKVAAVPGVQDAVGTSTGYAQLVAPDGKVVSTGGAPTIGLSFDPVSAMSALHIKSGTAPTGPDDVVIDAGTVKKYHFHIGDRVRILLTGPPETFTLTGIVTFGTADNLAGATIAAFDLPTAQRIFDEPDQYDIIDVLATPGTNLAQLKTAIARVLPANVEVVTGATVANQTTGQINQGLGFISTALLVFAFISLFVGSFTIFNTFSIIVGQRTRELALLRILGASRRQVFRSVLAEAFIVGLLSSVVGLALGVAAAAGLEALLDKLGITLPSGGIVFAPRTVIVGLVVGIGVTVISAVSPARRAVRIPPVAALTEHEVGAAESSRRRILVGITMALLGIVALAAGLSIPAIALVGIGALLAFVGVAMLAPLVARPVSSVLGRPLARLLGISGQLGRENSMRSPRRTAQTGAALMVGLALVSTIAVFGASVSRSATSSIDQAISADYIVTSSSNNGGSGAFSAAAGTAARKIPGVTAVSDVYGGQFDFRSDLSNLIAVSPDRLADTIILRLSSGAGASALAAGQLLVDTTTARSDHLVVGTSVPVKFALTGHSHLTVGGIYKPNALLGSFVVSDSYYRSHYTDPLPLALLLRTANAPTAAGKAAIVHALAAYPTLKIQTQGEFKQSQQKMVNQLLGIVYVLLALAVIIALIGIVNTLLLSVFERTHEIGLLRAVGMRRRQVRAMIRSEAVILSVFGALIGVIVGTGLGVAFAASLKQQGITDIVIPYGNLIIFLIIAALLGLLAASWPARRAARLDVLAAIATH